MQMLTRFSASFLAAAGVLSTAALAQQSQGDQASGVNQRQQQQQPLDGQSAQGDQSQQQQQQQQQQQAPEGFVLVEERVIVLTANEPQNHFLRVQEYLLQNDRQAAAAEAQIAANYLELQAGRADDQAKQQLQSSVQKLTQLARQISPAGEGQQPQQAQPGEADQQLQDQLTTAFVDANKALAMHFKAEASKGIENQKPIMAGHDLQAAADALEAAIVWSQQQPSADTTNALAEARQLAAELRTAGGPNVGINGWDEPQHAGDTDAAEAQPAAAHEGGQADRIPADASRTVEQLGTAIQSFADSQGAGGTGAGGSSATPPAGQNAQPQ